MHHNYFITLTAAISLFAVSCTSADKSARRVDALDDSAWDHSQWISVVDAPVITGPITSDNERAADGAGWFVTTVTNDKKVTDARWMTTGLGIYDLFVNGTRIGDEILKPGFTHGKKTKRSFTYDITDLIATGANATNTLAVQVTPGWWADKINTPSWRTDGMDGKKTAFRGVLQLTYSDGSKELLGTNTTDWLAGIAGPVTHAAIFDGETYDARIRPGYETPEKLSTPEVNTEFTGEILPSDGAEIYFRDDLALQPQRAYVWSAIADSTENEYGKVVIDREYSDGDVIVLKPGENLVVDFGQNCAAVPEFEFSATEGTTLSVRPGELLNDGNGALSRGMDGPEGSVHRQNLRTPDTGMMLDYTFGDSKGFVQYRPRYTFFGYRFMNVTADDEVRIKTMKSIPISSITREMETGTLSTGNDDINKLISNITWGQRSNYLSVPTDCPQRNERLGWMADTQVFAETGSFFANTDKFFHKWMRDVRDTQHELGGFPDVAPYAQYGSSEFCRFGWSDAGVIVPWVVWKQFGDTTIVNENWEALEKYMDLITPAKYSLRLLSDYNKDFQWADWLSYEPLESFSESYYYYIDANGQRVLKPEAIEYWNYLGACYWLIDAEMMRDMAAATGRDADKYATIASEARQHLTDNFINSDGTFKTDILNTMQTPALFALKTGIVSGDAKENMIARLIDNFKQHGNCLQTGFLGTSILMPTLSENGMTDIAYQLLFQRNNPSWLYSVDNGATTIWERWNSYMLDKGMGPQGMNSFNHYAYGCVAEWMWETMAGIASDTSAPGFKRIIMKPVPDKRLGHVNARYNSAAGLIESNWRYEGDKWIWEFSIPDGATALVTLPDGSDTTEYPAGSYKVELNL